VNIKKIVCAGIIFSMLATPCYASESLWERVPVKAKVVVVGLGAVVGYGIMTNPKGLFNIIQLWC